MCTRPPPRPRPRQRRRTWTAKPRVRSEPGLPSPGERQRRGLGTVGDRGRLGALGVAAAHLHADRAHPALPARARLGARLHPAAGGRRPGVGDAVLHVAPGPRAVAEPPRAVQRVRRALVRGDLHPALRLAGRVRRAADVQAGRLGQDAAAAGAEEPGAAAAVGDVPVGAVAGRGRRRGRLGARRAALPAPAAGRRRRRPLARGREGVPARGRQPALPPVAARRAALDRARRALRLQGRRAGHRGADVHRHHRAAGRVPPRTAGHRVRPGAVLAQAGQVHGRLHRLGRVDRAAGRVQRQRELHGHAGRGHQERTTSRSTTRCRSTR